MINAKKKERFLPGPGTIVLRQKDTNLVTGKPFRIKTCCSSQMLINSLREDTEYLLDLGVNGMGESNRTLPVVWLGRVNRYPYPRIKCINYGNLNQVTRSKQKRFSPEKGKEANEAEFELTPPSEGGEDDSFIIPAFEGDGGKSLAKVKDIELISDKPIKTKPYRMSPRQINILREEIKRLLELGVIEIGQSDYTSPLILVESPNKDPRPCVDYRRLNEITRAEFFHKYGRDSRKSECGSLCNGDGFVERLLSDSAHAESSEIRSFRYSIWHLYPQENDVRVNDIAIFSQGWKDHVKHIDIVLGRLRKAGLKVKPSKCKFAQEEVLFLGHRIGSGSRSPSDLKIKAIADFPRPTTKTHVRSFLGLVGYYSHYIPNYSTIASPLTDALKGKIKKEKITWDEKCGEAFEELKAKLVTQPILFAPDFATEFILQTDASEVGAGVVLSQRIEGEEHPIVFLSKNFLRRSETTARWKGN
ncbi:retrovirus-related Pol polyprotein from transposon 297 [Trichonephila clavipes]|nr:retrovirus-related Pol polyprotein from transposon 297 [Trichonephila clavipes]